MLEPNLSSLKAAAQEISSGQTIEEKIASLERAFQLFSGETARLDEVYQQLQKDFKDVNEELASANAKLLQKVRELDITTTYLKNILGNISQGLIFINRAGTITTFNRAAEAILDIPSVEVLFQLYKDCFADDLFGFSMEEALLRRREPPNPYIVVHGTGPKAKELEVDACFVPRTKGVSMSTTRDEHLDFTEGLIILFREVTDIQRLKRQAERNDRLKGLGEMAASVAHEIRNPLGGIKGFASLLQRDLKDQPHLQQMATYIVEGTESLNRLVTNVLNYARPIQLNLEPVDLIPLVLDVLYSVRIDPRLSQGIEYSLSVEVESLPVKVDSYLIRSVLLNMVTNAVQAMPQGGDILFNLRATDGDALLEIRDTGVGIADENLNKIFSPFFTTKSDGNGFGLTEALKIVQAHGGTIEVVSQVSKGTIFTIKLPLLK